MIDQVRCNRSEKYIPVFIINEKKKTCPKKREKSFWDRSHNLKKDSDNKEPDPER